MSDWKTYFEKHAKRKPREQLVRAVSYCSNKENALDLGAGTLIEAAFLLENGFSHVTAVDSSPESLEFAKHFDSERFKLETIKFDEFKLEPNTYDLVNAQYALPFYGKQNFESFIENIKKSLKIGGVFVGQFFGNRDDWNTKDKNLAFQTKEEVQNFLSDMEVIEFQEEEKEGNTASGNTKHWHLFHFIIRKK
ncbi:class I SAM-dependent methyltransferase [Candidatus Nomurabacteria bacterium]|nr:class I SAM-dependent methyltransferase [Candidatus Nomurabacteria bacterium]